MTTVLPHTFNTTIKCSPADSQYEYNLSPSDRLVQEYLLKIGRKISEGHLPENHSYIESDDYSSTHYTGIPMEVTPEQEKQWDKTYGSMKTDDEEWQSQLMKKYATMHNYTLKYPMKDEYTPEFIRRMSSQHQGIPIHKRGALHGRGKNNTAQNIHHKNKYNCSRTRTRKQIRK